MAKRTQQVVESRTVGHDQPALRRKALSLAVATALALPAAAIAQEQPAMLEEVVVSGFRQAVIDSIDTKREASSLVEAISAEDIGKLPDSSIAESLSRLPGISGQRVNGRISAISIRGFGQDFTAASLNGRELLGMGDNRGVEFDLYPSEILAGATVYKTPDATLMVQGVGGTVDLLTIKPLDSEQIVNVSATVEQNDLSSMNPDMDDQGYRGSFTYVDQFADDTIGVALSIATMESPSQEEWFAAWGYANSSSGNKILGGQKSYARSAMMNRDSISGILEFRPSEQLRVKVDGLYIDYLDEQVKRGLETPGADWGNIRYTELAVEDGLVTQGIFGTGPLGNQGEPVGDYVQIRNDSAEQESELTVFGFNAEYDINETWGVSFDAARSDVKKQISDLEIYSGFGRGEAGRGIVGDTIGFTMTNRGAVFDYGLPYGDYSLVKLAGAKNWGNDNPHSPRNDDQDGFINFADFDEELTTLRLQADAEFDGVFSGVQFGVYYSDREKSKVNNGYFLTDPAYPANSPIPEDVRRGTVTLDFLGGQEMVAIDGRKLYNSDFYALYNEGDFKANRLADTYTINEEIVTGYLKADYRFEAGSIPVTGNVGVQVANTDQSGDGFATQGSSTGVIATPVSEGTSYTDWLPSFNMAIALTDEHTIRLGASRTMSRTRMDKLKPSSEITFNPGNNIPTANLERSPWSAKSGDPYLEPIKVDQYDISWEYYFAEDGYVSLAYFLKDLVNWQTVSKVPMDFTDYYYAGLGVVYTFDGYDEQTVETEGGQIDGYEIQVALPFHIFTEALDGFGLLGHYTSLSNDLEINGDPADVVGLSDESWGLTGYFERGGFTARVSGQYRSEYTAEVRAGNNGLENTKVLETEIWDAEISYDFGKGGFGGALEGLSVFLSGTNLTDEPYVQYANDDTRQITRYSSYGSNYMLGASYRF